MKTNVQTFSYTGRFFLEFENFQIYLQRNSEHLMLVNNQLDALFLNVFIFIFTPLDVSSSKCPPSGGSVFINTPAGTTYSSG